MNKVYAITEQCQVFGKYDNINPNAITESVVIQNFGVYLDKKNAIKNLNRINNKFTKSLGKRTKFSLKEIDIRE